MPKKDFFDIKIPKSIEKPALCDQCGKPLPKRHVSHKNISQEVQVHNFCSRDCKNEWCAEQAEMCSE